MKSSQITLLLILISVSFSSSNGKFAAKIRKVYPKRNQIIVNQGKKHHIAKNDEACVFTKKGEGLYCGRVFKLQKKKSVIKINPRYLKQGMKVHFTTSRPKRFRKKKPLQLEVKQDSYGNFIN